MANNSGKILMEKNKITIEIIGELRPLFPPGFQW